jgi:hypothetical protein
MNLKKWLIAIVCIALTFQIACYYDNEEELYPDGGQPSTCDTASVTYSTKIQPLLQSKCYVCHSQAAALGSVIVEGYANARQYAISGQLYGSVNHGTGYSPMPQGGGKLPVCDIAAIKKWVDDGAPNN